jgi:hypothetical protein
VVNKKAGWSLWKTCSLVFQGAVDVALPVHGAGRIHAAGMVEHQERTENNGGYHTFPTFAVEALDAAAS